MAHVWLPSLWLTVLLGLFLHFPIIRLICPRKLQCSSSTLQLKLAEGDQYSYAVHTVHICTLRMGMYKSRSWNKMEQLD